jgi:hypothetical protein
MDESGLFTAAVGVRPPWRVDRVAFEPQVAQLDLFLDFPSGGRSQNAADPSTDRLSRTGLPVNVWSTSASGAIWTRLCTPCW